MPPQQRFVDPESDFSERKEDNFEQIVVAQMRRCADLLSKDIFAVIQQTDRKGRLVSTHTKDLRDEIDNAVDTFYTLMDDFIKETHRKLIKELEKEIGDKLAELQEKVVMIPGIGRVRAKDALLPRDHPTMVQRLDLILKGNRKLFKILIKVYNKSKRDIERFSRE